MRINAAHGCAPPDGKGDFTMLHLALLPEEYLTIDGNIVVQLARISGSRAYLRLEADRSVTIVRGKLLERAGTSKPDCLCQRSQEEL